MIKAQKTLFGDIEEINIRESLNEKWDRLENNYTVFKKSTNFWINGEDFIVSEIRDAKWFKKAPNYRPSGKPRYELTIVTWDENGKNPQYKRETFETLAKLERSL